MHSDRGRPPLWAATPRCAPPTLALGLGVAVLAVFLVAPAFSRATLSLSAHLPRTPVRSARTVPIPASIAHRRSVAMQVTPHTIATQTEEPVPRQAATSDQVPPA
eukprot:EG_transcript_63287